MKKYWERRRETRRTIPINTVSMRGKADPARRMSIPPGMGNVRSA